MQTETAQDYQDFFDDWKSDYGISEFYEFSGDNEDIVKDIDPHLVWTQHGTCENNKITNGFKTYQSTCGCWTTHGWWVGTKTWLEPYAGEETFIQIDASATIDCLECNPDGDYDYDKIEQCNTCEKDGYAVWYCD
jgi:hypothetical protein